LASGCFGLSCQPAKRRAAVPFANCDVPQNWLFGLDSDEFVDLARAGPLRITQAPIGRHVETSAQQGDLDFSSRSGASWILHLHNDQIEIVRTTVDDLGPTDQAAGLEGGSRPYPA